MGSEVALARPARAARRHPRGRSQGPGRGGRSARRARPARWPADVRVHVEPSRSPTIPAKASGSCRRRATPERLRGRRLLPPYPPLLVGGQDDDHRLLSVRRASGSRMRSHGARGVRARRGRAEAQRRLSTRSRTSATRARASRTCCERMAPYARGSDPDVEAPLQAAAHETDLTKREAMLPLRFQQARLEPRALRSPLRFVGQRRREPAWPSPSVSC